jgi:integrase
VYLTPAQVEELADAMTRVDPWHRALVWLGCYAGPRIGELAALRWADLDPMRRTLSIERKVVELAGAGFVEGQTKTKAGRRTVTLPRRVVEEIERHRDLVWSRLGEQPLVFPAHEGGYLRPKNLRRRAWLRAVDIAGLTGMTFHDMRHTAVSLWVAAGATDMEVAKWAGHKNAAFTKSRYAHLFPEHGEALADRLDAFIASATPTPAANIRHLR